MQQRSEKRATGTWLAVGLVALGLVGALVGLKWRRLQPEKAPPPGEIAPATTPVAM